MVPWPGSEVMAKVAEVQGETWLAGCSEGGLDDNAVFELPRSPIGMEGMEVVCGFDFFSMRGGECCRWF